MLYLIMPGVDGKRRHLTFFTPPGSRTDSHTDSRVASVLSFSSSSTGAGRQLPWLFCVDGSSWWRLWEILKRFWIRDLRC